VWYSSTTLEFFVSAAQATNLGAGRWSMSTLKDDYEAGLDPKAREVLEFLRANPADKGHTVMDVYAGIYSEEEKSAHLRGSGGVGERFREIQRWLDEFREKEYVKSKIVSATIFYSASE
jgi:hypothetical protein